MSEIPAELVPNEPALEQFEYDEYAALLTEIAETPITEDTGH